MKCARTKCPNIAAKDGQQQGLCVKHYAATSDRGYRDGQKVRDRIELLISRGIGVTALRDTTGLSITYLRTSNTPTVIKRVHDAIFSIPLPRAVVASESCVPSVGTIRRIQSLMALGWPAYTLSAMLGWERSWTSKVLRGNGWVRASTAADVAALYVRLQLTPGTSGRARNHAHRNGWVPPFAWDEDSIDDPTAQPNVGAHEPISFPDRYRELREHVGLPDVRVAAAMGIELESLERQLLRYGMSKGRAA